MAIKGNEVKNIDIKRYIGNTRASIIAVNPTKEELSEIMGRPIEKDQVYTTQKDGKTQTRVAIYMRSESLPEAIGVATFFIANAESITKEGKHEVMDIYGNRAYCTQEEFDNQVIPLTSKGGKYNIAADYSPAYVGEFALTEFLRKHFGVKDSLVYNDNKEWEFVESSKLAECECRLETIKEIANGDVSEIRGLVEMFPNAASKVAFGVRTDANGRMFQEVFTFNGRPNGNCNKIHKEIARVNPKDSEFRDVDIQEYAPSANISSAAAAPQSDATKSKNLPF